MDTNVAIVANDKAHHVNDDCREACRRELKRIEKKQYRLVMDCNGQILDEYKRYLNLAGQPGPGDAFFKWAFNHSIVWVYINEDAALGYREFPDDPDLNGFDPSDRKFVAVARAADQENPPLILNASDTDWWHYRSAFRKHNIQIKFLCCELMNQKKAAVKRKMTP